MGSVGLTGKIAEAALGRAGITVNKNLIPFDPRKPMDPSGIRMGTPALTTRGMKEDAIRQVAAWIVAALRDPEDLETARRLSHEIQEFAKELPGSSRRVCGHAGLRSQGSPPRTRLTHARGSEAPHEGVTFMGSVIDDVQREFLHYKMLAEKAMAGLDDQAFFERLGPPCNPVALIVKHMGGNLRSRWTDFLTSDGEKPNRNREGEFEIVRTDTRGSLMAGWEEGWATLLSALEGLTEEDLGRTVFIRGEKHTAQQAILRALTHAAYHVGQVMYVARLLKPDSEWATIAPGGSSSYRGTYRSDEPGTS